MKTKVEGILLRKTPFQERHLIGDVLLRNGKVLSICFYGGRGGGRHQKSSTLELGHLMQVELRHQNRKSDLLSAKEWVQGWAHKRIRSQYKAFTLLCFYLEVISKVSDHMDIKDDLALEDQHDEGLFRVLSNALFFLENELQKGKELYPYNHLVLFLSKLLLVTGVYPMREACVLSERPIRVGDATALMPEHGGFAHKELLPHEQRPYGTENLWGLLGHIWHTPYQDVLFEEDWGQNSAKGLLNYMCFQFNLRQSGLKSASLLLS